MFINIMLTFHFFYHYKFDFMSILMFDSVLSKRVTMIIVSKSFDCHSPCSSNLLTSSNFNNQFFAQSRQDGDKAFLLSFFENFFDLFSNIREMFSFWQVAIGLDLTIIIQHFKGFIINIQKSVLNSFDDWCINHITGVISAIINFLSKNVFALEDNLCRSMLSWLSSRNISDLAWETFDHDQRSWLKSISIGLVAHGSSGIGVLKLFVVRHPYSKLFYKLYILQSKTLNNIKYYANN